MWFCFGSAGETPEFPANCRERMLVPRLWMLKLCGVRPDSGSGEALSGEPLYVKYSKMLQRRWAPDRKDRRLFGKSC
jgi:hypothetical protein